MDFSWVWYLRALLKLSQKTMSEHSHVVHQSDQKELVLKTKHSLGVWGTGLAGHLVSN